MGHAAGLTAGHGVAGNELHALRQHLLHRLHHAALYAGNIGYQRAGADQVAVPLDPFQQHSGVQAKDDVIRVLHQVVKVFVAALADIGVFQRIIQRALAVGNAGHAVAFLAEHLGIFAAQQAQAHN